MLTIAPDNRPITEKIAIAAPCNVSWETMTGDDQKRLCGGCSKDVYNLSAMSQSEAESFLQKANELPCLKFSRCAGCMAKLLTRIGKRKKVREIMSATKSTTTVAIKQTQH